LRHGQRQLDVPAQRLVARGGHARVGPVPLVEDEPQRIGAAVQGEAVSAHGDFAQRRVAEDVVDDTTGLVEELEFGLDD
jgi:hypothetical protein